MAIWFITGVSSGFGRALGEVLLEGGHTVAGTVRNEKDKASFEQLAPGRAIAVLMDVTDESAVRRGIADIESKVGPIAMWRSRATVNTSRPATMPSTTATIPQINMTRMTPGASRP